MPVLLPCWLSPLVSRLSSPPATASSAHARVPAMPHDLRPATAGVPAFSIPIANQTSQAAETIDVTHPRVTSSPSTSSSWLGSIRHHCSRSVANTAPRCPRICTTS